MKSDTPYLDTITAPASAGPDDSAIILGGGVPACLASVYASIVLFQAASAPGLGINRQPSLFIGVRINGLTTDFGWLIWDHATVCGYKVISSWQGLNAADGLGTLGSSIHFHPLLLGALPNFNRYQLMFGYYDFTGNPPVEMYFNQGLGIGEADPAKGPIRVDNISAPRGPRMAVSGNIGVSSGNGGLTPAAESATFSAWTAGTNSMNWRKARVYRCTVNFAVDNNLAGAAGVYAWSRYQVTIRSANGGAGTALFASFDTSVQNTHLFDDKTVVFYLQNTSGADITSGLGMTITKLQSSAGATMFLESASIAVEDAGGTDGPLAAIAGVFS